MLVKIDNLSKQFLSIVREIIFADIAIHFLLSKILMQYFTKLTSLPLFVNAYRMAINISEIVRIFAPINGTYDYEILIFNLFLCTFIPFCCFFTTKNQ
jgi:hypothetical protein